MPWGPILRERACTPGCAKEMSDLNNTVIFGFSAHGGRGKGVPLSGTVIEVGILALVVVVAASRVLVGIARGLAIDA